MDNSKFLHAATANVIHAYVEIRMGNKLAMCKLLCMSTAYVLGIEH